MSTIMQQPLWSEKQEAEERRLVGMIEKPEDWWPYYKAGWGFRRVVEIPEEYLSTGNEQWTDYEPYWREDLGRFIWTPAACGTRERGEIWKSQRHL